MKIFCSPNVLDFFHNDAKGALTQARLNSWFEMREYNPGQACMPGQVEHFRFRETEHHIGLDINWVGFRINDASRLIGAVVDVPEAGCYFFALDLTQTHDYQKTLVENASLRQGYLNAIKTFLSSGDTIFTSSSSSAALSASADAPHSFKRMVQHGKVWLSPDITQIQLMDMPIHQGALCFAPPGAGKTMLGVQRAKDYVQHGLTVAMCTPTRRLAESLIKECGEQEIAQAVRVQTFEDVLESLGLARDKTLVDLEFFTKWCSEDRPKTLEKLSGTSKKSFTKAVKYKSLSLLWQEFQYVFMQTPDWKNPSTAHLSLDEYCGLGVEQSRVAQEQRADIYQSVFAAFLANITDNPKLYFPPLEAHKLYQQDLPADIKVDALVVDEVQKLHPWVSACFFKLLNNPLAAGQFFICGDAHQGAECQQLRVAETLTNHLVGQKAKLLLGHLLVNYRSSQAVTRLVLQTHSIEMMLLGSMEKKTHLRPEINCDAPEGQVKVLPYDDTIRKLIESDAGAYVLIPDESSRQAALQLWPKDLIVTLGEFAGLSGSSIVMYGFDQHFHKELREIGALFGEGTLPSWDTQCAVSRKGIDYAQRTCLQSIYTAASRAMISLYIIDNQHSFLRQIVANSCLDAPIAGISSADSRLSRPEDWFERACRDFSNHLIDNARAILLDKTKMGTAYQEINALLKSSRLEDIFSRSFASFLPLDSMSLAAGVAESKSPPQIIEPPSGSIKAVPASAAGAYAKRPKPRTPPPQDGVLSLEEQQWVNKFSPSAQNLKKLLDMKERWPGFREHLLFVAEAQNGKKETIFIKFITTGWLNSLLDFMEKKAFLAEITPLGLNYMCKAKAYFNMSLIYFLCGCSNGIALLRKYPDLTAKIHTTALNAILPESVRVLSGKSGAFFLCALSEGIGLLRDNRDLTAKIDTTALNALLQDSEGPDAGKSAAYFLCASLDGRHLLRDNPDLVAKMNSSTLNAILPDSAHVDAGKSAAFFLCASAEGKELLLANPDLAAKINETALNTPLPKSTRADVGKSGVFVLCASLKGIELLASNPGLIAKIGSKALNMLLPESTGIHAGKSAAYFLYASLSGKALLRDNPDLAAKINHRTLNAVFPKSAAAEAGKSCVMVLCASPTGIELLRRNPGLVASIDANTLNTLLPELAETEAGKSAAYFLCASRSGRELLRDNPGLAAKINHRTLNAALPKSAAADAGKSCVMVLCASPTGIELLSNNPGLVANIDANTLNTLLPELAETEAGKSAAYFLCSSPEGIALLRDNPGLAAKIDETALNAPPESAGVHARKTAAYFLCSSRSGRALLGDNPDLAAKINHRTLNAALPKSAEADAGKSCVMVLCASSKGIELLSNNPGLAAKIDANALNMLLPESAGVHAGKSAAYFLCSSPEGIALLRDNPGLAAKIDANALNMLLPESAGVHAGKTAAYFLCASSDGRNILRDNPDLVAKMNSSTLNAILPDSAENDAGKSAVFFLCASAEGKELLLANPNLAAQINEKALNEVLPKSTKFDAGKSALSALCASQTGIAILSGNPGLVANIDAYALNMLLPELASVYAGKSAAYFLCASPDGRKFLIDNPNLAAKIDSITLNAPLPELAGVHAGKSAACFLCASPSGRALLKSNDWLRSIIPPPPEWSFSSHFKDDSGSETMESWLAKYNQEGELASNSPGVASVSIFTSKEEYRPSSPSSRP
jgi:hypothetical protein